MAEKVIEISHPNGYSGKLYGNSSMSIYKDGKEVMHTGTRNPEIKDKETLYKHLEDMPTFLAMLFGRFEDIYNDAIDDEI